MLELQECALWAGGFGEIVKLIEGVSIHRPNFLPLSINSLPKPLEFRIGSQLVVLSDHTLNTILGVSYVSYKGVLSSHDWILIEIQPFRQQSNSWVLVSIAVDTVGRPG